MLAESNLVEADWSSNGFESYRTR